METKNTINPNLELSLKYQEKFDFYFLGLIFTVLALSIQTAEFNNLLISNIFEILSWVFFAASGLIGMWRMEWIAPTYETAYFVDILETEERINPERNDIENLLKAINEKKESLSKQEKYIMIKYKFQRWLFIVGIISIMIARSWLPIHNIYNCFKS